jgi:hypothetical protein
MATNASTTRIAAYENVSVWDTDSIESNLALTPAGQDATYIDKSSSGVMFWSMHGTCNRVGAYPARCNLGPCPANERCNDMGGVNACQPYFDTNMVTCSSGDQRTGSNRGNVGLDREVVLGESNGFRGLGTNGNIDIGIFDTSCPFQMHYLERSAPMFGGVHMIGGYAGYFSAGAPLTVFGDRADSSTGGQYYGTRLLAYQPLAGAHLDVARLDESAPFVARACTVAISCAANSTAAGYHLLTESWPTVDTSDETQTPTWCSFYQWCNF